MSVLLDAGPLIALLDRRDENHVACVNAISKITHRLVTTWPVLTEAMYFAAHIGRGKAQDGLWEMIGGLTIASIDADEDRVRMRDLMRKYADHPMDLADASLVRVAEREGIRKIFTLDRADFSSYRIARKGPTQAASFQLIPLR